ncbi:MAG: HAMP domain-containing histidine kinase [Prevotellaceae bacterium]|jgi:signal transduction histidine kinase|nr:HAMP domain-containing histidine kinase [Prevotellaceae bacterium]
MTEKEHAIAGQLIQIVNRIIEGRPHFPLEVDGLEGIEDDTFRTLSLQTIEMGREYQEAYNFLMELAAGKLYTESPRHNNMVSPFKQLHSELRYLTWQIKEIANGDYDQHVTFSGDFSEAINKMILALRERKVLEERLNESNKTKDKLFSIIAHDLKNPFNSLLGFVQILQQEVEKEQPDIALVREFIHVLDDSISKAYDLLINLLDWSRLQRNRITITPVDSNLNEIVTYAIRVGSTTAVEKNIAVNYLTPGNYPAVTDGAIINVILRNLLGNAVKFTPNDGHIDVSVHRTDTRYEISVKDSGIGIRPEDLSKLFRADVTHTTAGTNNEAGTGLGLMLCKEFAHKLGGEIWVESTYGEGSKFTFTIPASPAS